MIALILIILLVLVAIYFWQRPSFVVNRSFQKLAYSRTQSFDGHIMLTNLEATQSLIGEGASLNVNFDGVFERTSPRNSLKTHILISTDTDSVTMRIEGDIIFINEDAFIRITKAPPTIPLLSQFKNQWIKTNRGGEETDSQLKDDELLIKNIRKTGKTEVNDNSVTTYEISTSTTAVLHFLDQIASILGTRLTAEQVNNFKNNVSNAEDIKTTVGVSKWSHSLHLVNTSITMPGGNTVVFTLHLNNRNKKVDISPPDQARSLEEIINTAQDTNQE